MRIRQNVRLNRYRWDLRLGIEESSGVGYATAATSLHLLRLLLVCFHAKEGEGLGDVFVHVEMRVLNSCCCFRSWIYSMLELCTVWCALKSATTYEPPAWTDHYASLPKGGVADQCYWYGCQWVLGLEDGSGLGHEHNMADKWFDDVESDECVLHADLESFWAIPGGSKSLIILRTLL